MKKPYTNMSCAIICLGVMVLSDLVLGFSGASSGTVNRSERELGRAATLAAPVPPGPARPRYHIDSSHSRFMVRAFAGGLLSFAAHNHNIAIRDFTGDAEVTYGSVEPASLTMRVKAGSLAVTDKVSDSDREKIETTMRNDVLETSKYPDIVFQSTGVNATRLDEGKYQVKIPGNLTLHGATRSVTRNARLEFGRNEFHAVGEFPVKQTDFRIKHASVAGRPMNAKDPMRL